MISKDNWRKYIDKLAAIDDQAADLMQKWIDENGLEDGEATIQYAYALATKYGEASATLACEMYDYMAEIMDADVPEAMPAETATLKEVAKSTTWGKYHSPSQIPSAVGRHVRQAGADTMMQNAKRDKAQWAWVPQGDTCAFCITLASRGWQNASRTVLKGNHAEHIHQNCDCTFAIAFKEKDKRQYDYIYDPEKYKEMYYGADGFTSDGKINALRRDIYQQNKERINAQKRDAYQARQFSSKLSESKNTFHTYGDYLRKKLGSAKENYPDELQEIEDSVKKYGGEIVYLTDSSKMVTNVRKGKPPIIEVDEKASIAGIRHEYRHFLDDMNNGNPGLAYYLRDPDKFFEFEKRGYEEELVIAKALGYNEIVTEIEQEIEMRRKEIYGDE